MNNKQSLIELTKDLIAIPSVSASKNNKGVYQENILADFIANYCKKNGIPHDFIPTTDGRKCVYIWKKGSTKRTIVLIAHLDTVGFEDYEGKNALETGGPDEKYLYGRGSADMKAGIAVGIHLMKDLWKESLQTNVIFIAAPDEENESTGILEATKFLQTLKEKHHLSYIGSINLDSTFQDKQSQKVNIVAGGSIGKLLPCFYIMGKSAHVSDPYEGLSSSAIASKLLDRFHANGEYSDKNTRTGEFAPPPTCLKMIDIKHEYNVQLPIKSFLYFNYLTYTETPKEVLLKMKDVAEKSLLAAIRDNREKQKNFFTLQKKKFTEIDQRICVYTYGEIEKIARENNKLLEKELDIVKRNSENLDVREQNFALIETVAKHANLSAPYIICFFSPPYYPSSCDTENEFIQKITTVLKIHEKKDKKIYHLQSFSEGVSDMNYLQLNKNALADIQEYLNNNPISQARKEIDLAVLADISMPIVSIGSYGFNMHGADEKVEIAFSFSILPKLLYDIIISFQ